MPNTLPIDLSGLTTSSSLEPLACPLQKTDGKVGVLFQQGFELGPLSNILDKAREVSEQHIHYGSV